MERPDENIVSLTLTTTNLKDFCQVGSQFDVPAFGGACEVTYSGLNHTVLNTPNGKIHFATLENSGHALPDGYKVICTVTMPIDSNGERLTRPLSGYVQNDQEFLIS